MGDRYGFQRDRRRRLNWRPAGSALAGGAAADGLRRTAPAISSGGASHSTCAGFTGAAGRNRRSGGNALQDRFTLSPADSRCRTISRIARQIGAESADARISQTERRSLDSAPGASNAGSASISRVQRDH
jgi:hypothetical protein